MFLRQPEVLIIDPARGLSTQLLPHLEHMNIGVMVALSMRSALRQAQDGLPDLVLLSRDTPGLDAGCAGLRQHPATAHIPVIGLAAVVSADTLRQTMQEGAIACLSLPLDLRVVTATILCHITLQLRLSGSQPWQRPDWVQALTQAVAELQAAERHSGEALAALCNKLHSTEGIPAAFETHLGSTVPVFASHLRLARANERLRSSALSLQAISDAAGYASLADFSDAYHALYGIAPNAFQRAFAQGANKPFFLK